jgi:uncharacterized Zn finger protein
LPEEDRQEELWRKLEELVSSKKAKAYDEAVQWIVDLRDLAGTDGDMERFQVRLKKLEQLHTNKPSFLQRLRKLETVATSIQRRTPRERSTV